MSWSTIQTTLCIDGNHHYTELSICPLLKPSYYNQIITDSGIMYFQLHDKIVSIAVDGIVKVWYNKPTMKDAFTTQDNGTSAHYYEFREDDSVFHSYRSQTGNKVTLEWSPQAFTSYIVGTPLKGYFDKKSYTYEETISCNVCGSDCVGGDYENWRFCSRSCMVDYSRDY